MPRLVMVMVAPPSWSDVSLLSLARWVRSDNSRQIVRRSFIFASRITGTIRPPGISTATPMWIRLLILIWVSSAMVLLRALWFSNAMATAFISMAV